MHIGTSSGNGSRSEISLSRPYRSRYGAPLLERVNPDIFTRRYFTHCMSCGFCADRCCQYGVDVDAPALVNLLGHSFGLKPYIGMQVHDGITWEWGTDPDFPGKTHTRTKVINGMCAFHNKQGRGCGIHAYCVDHGIDYHLLKPLFSILFPLTVDAGVLRPSQELYDEDLICAGSGPTLYEGVRDELAHYFGTGFVVELDEIWSHFESGSRIPSLPV